MMCCVCCGSTSFIGSSFHREAVTAVWQCPLILGLLSIIFLLSFVEAVTCASYEILYVVVLVTKQQPEGEDGGSGLFLFPWWCVCDRPLCCHGSSLEYHVTDL